MTTNHKNFIRISWEEAFIVLEKALQHEYGTEGKIILKKDYGYDGVGDFYDTPTYVDIELEANKVGDSPASPGK